MYYRPIFPINIDVCQALVSTLASYWGYIISLHYRQYIKVFIGINVHCINVTFLQDMEDGIVHLPFCCHYTT